MTTVFHCTRLQTFIQIVLLLDIKFSLVLSYFWLPWSLLWFKKSLIYRCFYFPQVDSWKWQCCIKEHAFLYIYFIDIARLLYRNIQPFTFPPEVCESIFFNNFPADGVLPCSNVFLTSCFFLSFSWLPMWLSIFLYKWWPFGCVLWFTSFPSITLLLDCMSLSLQFVKGLYIY